MKKYQSKIKIEEGITSIPKYEKEFEKWGPADILGSLIEAMKSTGAAKKLKTKTWNMMFDLFNALESELYED